MIFCAAKLWNNTMNSKNLICNTIDVSNFHSIHVKILGPTNDAYNLFSILKLFLVKRHIWHVREHFWKRLRVVTQMTRGLIQNEKAIVFFHLQLFQFYSAQLDLFVRFTTKTLIQLWVCELELLELVAFSREYSLLFI